MLQFLIIMFSPPTALIAFLLVISIVKPSSVIFDESAKSNIYSLSKVETLTHLLSKLSGRNI